MRKASMDKFFKCVEDYAPITLAILVVLFFIIRPIHIVDEMDSAMSAIISLTSILLGFIGVIITLLFGLSHTKIINVVFDEKYNYQKRLKRFFVVSCCAGFILILLSVMMFFKNTVQGIGIVWIWYILKNSFVFSLIYFLSASFRLIYIVIELIFLAGAKYDESDEDTTDDGTVDYAELRNKYK